MVLDHIQDQLCTKSIGAWYHTLKHVLLAYNINLGQYVAVVLPEVVPLRTNQSKEGSWLSEFQAELVELASILSGDYFLSSFTETKKKMTVKEADTYIKRAVSRYFQASKQAIRLGAHESAIVDMRPSLTSKNTNP